ncbi:transposon Tf2-9 polyprotein [Trichonephila clavipes]|nr:transposon Tf2-9 polyprotein [Trichonephila clavipes]
MGGRRSLRIATVIFISALLLFTRKGISGSASHPTEKGDAFPRLEEGNVPINTSWFGMFFGNFPRLGRYIKNFAKRALPLTNLLRKDTPFEWTSETQEAFDDIKKAILNPPVLALPDQNAELQITTDASSRGIGAVLEQKYPNSEVKPLYFF